LRELESRKSPVEQFAVTIGHNYVDPVPRTDCFSLGRFRVCTAISSRNVPPSKLVGANCVFTVLFSGVCKRCPPLEKDSCSYGAALCVGASTKIDPMRRFCVNWHRVPISGRYDRFEGLQLHYYDVISTWYHFYSMHLATCSTRMLAVQAPMRTMCAPQLMKLHTGTPLQHDM
jgi:hypothetical protein